MSKIKQVELTIEHAQAGVAAGKALARLTSNRDFQKIIIDGYLREEAIRLVHLKADPGMFTKEDQEAIDAQILAIGRFGAWLKLQKIVATQSEKDLADNQLELEALREEEAEGAI